MGQLGQSRGRSFRWDPPVLEFARHYGVALKVCRAGDAARKGKVERPFRDLKTGFLAEMDLDPPSDIAELNRRAERWLAVHAHAVVHRSTKVTPDERFRTEQPLLGGLPRVRFDTSRREPRRVGRFPLIEWDAVFYSVPPEAVGALVEVRQPVVEPVVEIRHAGQLVAVHRLAAPGAEPQWLPEHRAAGEAIALGRHGRHLRAVAPTADAPPAAGPLLELGDGDYDVEVPDLQLFGVFGPHPDDHPDPDRRSDRHTDAGFSGCECFGGGW
jgi:hypothetical protein